MKQSYPFASFVAVALLSSAAQADFVNVLPPPDNSNAIAHQLTGVSPMLATPEDYFIAPVEVENSAQLYAKAFYALTPDTFFIDSIDLARTSTTTACISGYVAFETTQDVYYSLAGELNVTGQGAAGKSNISSKLISYDNATTFFDFNHTDTLNPATFLNLVTDDSTANGLLAANTKYIWFFEMELADNATATAGSYATGYVALNFSWSGDSIATPEPTSLGLLAAACGLLLRRRR